MVETKNVEKQKKSLGSIAAGYLILYNFVQTLGWSFLLYQMITYYIYKPENTLYDHVSFTLNIFQNLAVLEVAHAFIRIVPSNPIITLQQVASRVMVVCGVLYVTDLPKSSFGFPLLLVAWSVTEIIRYSNYTLNLVNAVPHFIVWLRYTTFIVLYPIGVTGELLCLNAARDEAKETGLWSISMPNIFNVIFHYHFLLLFIMLIYIPLFPQMYLHMFSQRKKVLGRGSQQKKVL